MGIGAVDTTQPLSLHMLGMHGLASANYAVEDCDSGGLMLGAFFMATDMVTTPVTPRGMLLYGVGCGLITVLIP